MKKILAVLAITLALSACNDAKQQQEKALLDDVIKLHDNVMGKDEQLMKNKMKIDTLLITVKDTAQKNQLARLSAGLIVSEEAMENWMQKFDPEQKDKSHDEKVAYLTAQKKQVTVIDSQINLAIQRSTQYLNQIKK